MDIMFDLPIIKCYIPFRFPFSVRYSVHGVYETLYKGKAKKSKEIVLK